jgi:hypothetical protein
MSTNAGAVSGRPAAERLQVLRGEAGLALESVVGAGRADQRSDEGEPISDAGQLRQQLTDVQTGDLRGDRPELAADLDRRVRLQVDRVHVRRPAVEVDVDDRPGGRLDPRRILGPEQVG